MIYGYIRVSTRDQNTDRQLIALKEYGIKPENILTDKILGKDFNRPAYRRLLKRMYFENKRLSMSVRSSSSSNSLLR